MSIVIDFDHKYVGQIRYYQMEGENLDSLIPLFSQRYISSNFSTSITQTPFYKNAAINYLLNKITEEGGQQMVLDTLASGLRAHSEEEELVPFVELFAPLAYAWGYEELAAKAILRISRARSTQTLQSTAKALAKSMPASTYHAMIKESTVTELVQWRNRAS